jgi:DNA-binding response OmpR family regulator
MLNGRHVAPSSAYASAVQVSSDASIASRHDAVDTSDVAPLVLIVEDEVAVASSLAYHLCASGFRVVTAADGVAGLAAAEEECPALIVLDLMLPKMDGLDVCRHIRATSDVPIIMLTAKSEEMDRVVGLELGADDYVVKPFSVRELTARIRGLIRRASSFPRAWDTERILVADIEMDLRGRTVVRRGREIKMKPKEFDLLCFLARNTEQVFTRQQLLDRVWGYEFLKSGRTVDVHVRWLREKIEHDPSTPRHLITIRGVGYKFAR